MINLSLMAYNQRLAKIRIEPLSPKGGFIYWNTDDTDETDKGGFLGKMIFPSCEGQHELELKM
jgi:hypothetical protein